MLNRTCHRVSPFITMTAAALLAGCASWVDDRREPSADADVATARDSAARKRAFDADLRARLEELRRRPDLASEDLIRELERFVHDRGQQAPAVAAPAIPAPVAKPVVPEAPVARPAPRVIVARPPAAKPSPRPEAATATVAAVPAATTPAAMAVAVRPPTLSQAEQLFARARTLESDHQLALAVPLYSDASRQGHAAATVRLMEIYARGGQGVARNYLAAVKYKDLAVQQGVQLDYPPRR